MRTALIASTRERAAATRTCPVLGEVSRETRAAAHSYPASCSVQQQAVGAQADAGPAPQSSGPLPGGPGTLTVSQACDRPMEEYCNRCNATDMAACFTRARTWCYAGRDGA